ncbi:MAG: hypothetical protein K2I99_07070 [Bacteroidaceae bacterium]|nr:hypothetical protein [Bacteroidaceae bacterium]
MKKTYLKPETETIIMNAERVICTSSALDVLDEFDAITNPQGPIMESPLRNPFDLDIDHLLK